VLSCRGRFGEDDLSADARHALKIRVLDTFGFRLGAGCVVGRERVLLVPRRRRLESSERVALT
jgi:hypothetical protein